MIIAKILVGAFLISFSAFSTDLDKVREKVLKCNKYDAHCVGMEIIDAIEALQSDSGHHSNDEVAKLRFSCEGNALVVYATSINDTAKVTTGRSDRFCPGMADDLNKKFGGVVHGFQRFAVCRFNDHYSYRMDYYKVSKKVTIVEDGFVDWDLSSGMEGCIREMQKANS